MCKNLLGKSTINVGVYTYWCKWNTCRCKKYFRVKTLQGFFWI